jgi:hypothetical protein
MLKWFRKALLHRVYKNTIHGFSKPDRSRNSKILKNISVILDHRLGIAPSYFLEIAEHLNVPKKNISVLTFFPHQSEITEEQYQSSYCPKSISNWGVLNDTLSDFCKRKSDVLINFYEKDDINLKYISAKKNRKLSIGFTSVDHELNDLILEVDAQNIEVFISECIKYLKIFFTTKK